MSRARTARTGAPARPALAARLRTALASLLVLAALAGADGVAAQDQARIGYVDMKRLVDNAPQISSGSDRLRDEFAARDRLLKADEARLAELLDRQRREAGLTTPQAAQGLADEVEALDRKVRRTRDSLREELRRRSEEEIEVRWRQLQEAVAAFAREQGYDLILTNPVFYASPAVDVTDQVLTRLRRDQAATAPAGDGG
jgi:outer membrane protein